MAEEKEEGLMLDKKTMDVLITNIIPTSKYFEVRFDYLQQQIDAKFDYLQQQVSDVKLGIISLEDKIDKRFTAMQSDIDKRFDRVDKRFEQIDTKLDKLLERVDIKIDAGLRENRVLTVRLFTFAMTFAAISMVGLLGKMLQIF
ncbi:MAG: hypothetical protein ABH870_06985 [bacterium]